MYSFILLKYFSFLEIIYNFCVLARLSDAAVLCLVRARVDSPMPPENFFLRLAKFFLHLAF